MQNSISQKKRKRSLDDQVIEEIKEDINEKRENIASWLTYSLRELMTYDDIRNSILRKYLVRLDLYHLGSTFSYLEKEDQPILEKYLETLPENKISLFTASNFVDPLIKEEKEEPETHFQSYIYDPLDKKLYVLDPAKSFGEESQRQITNQIIVPYFLSKRNLTQQDIILVPNYCQVSNRDVFCQTWSLILLIQTINKKEGNTFISDLPKTPKKKTIITPSKKQKREPGFLRNKTTEEKRIILKNFFVQILEDKKICKKFKEIYEKSISSLKKEFLYLSIKNQCKWVSQLQSKDF